MTLWGEARGRPDAVLSARASHPSITTLHRASSRSSDRSPSRNDVESVLNRWLVAGDRWLMRVPRTLMGTVALAVVIGIGALDPFTGNELSSAVFYTVPIGAAARYTGRPWALAVCNLAAATWFVADTAAGATYSYDWIPSWNTGVRLGVFLLVAELLARLRAALGSLRRLAETDALTGLATARHFADAVDAELHPGTALPSPGEPGLRRSGRLQGHQ